MATCRAEADTGAPAATPAATPAPAPPPPPAPAPAPKPAKPAPMSASEAQAQATCPTDIVVWVNEKSHIYHFKGTHNYGTTKSGTICAKAQPRPPAIARRRMSTVRKALRKAGRSESANPQSAPSLGRLGESGAEALLITA